MEEQIIKLLKENSWEMQKGRFVIAESNMDEIAQNIVKLFSISDVSDSMEQIIKETTEKLSNGIITTEPINVL